MCVRVRVCVFLLHVKKRQLFLDSSLHCAIHYHVRHLHTQSTFLLDLVMFCARPRYLILIFFSFALATQTAQPPSNPDCVPLLASIAPASQHIPTTQHRVHIPSPPRTTNSKTRHIPIQIPDSRPSSSRCTYCPPAYLLPTLPTYPPTSLSHTHTSFSLLSFPCYPNPTQPNPAQPTVPAREYFGT